MLVCSLKLLRHQRNLPKKKKRLLKYKNIIGCWYMFPQTAETPTLSKKIKILLDAGMLSVRSSLLKKDELIMKYILCARPFIDAANS